MWNPHDMLLVIGELTMEKRVLEDHLEAANARIKELEEKENERAEGDGKVSHIA